MTQKKKAALIQELWGASASPEQAEEVINDFRNDKTLPTVSSSLPGDRAKVILPTGLVEVPVLCNSVNTLLSESSKKTKSLSKKQDAIAKLWGASPDDREVENEAEERSVEDDTQRVSLETTSIPSAALLLSLNRTDSSEKEKLEAKSCEQQ